MKKSLLIGFTIYVLFLFMTIPVFAVNGPHQGPGFAADTDACAGCHRAHTGTASKLLSKGSTKYTFCTACHNGSGANSNVESGIFEGDADIIYEGVNSKTHGEAGKGLNGGGFVSAVPYTDRQSRSGPPIILTGDLQRHDVTGGDNVTKPAWGGGDTGPSQDIEDFTCVSCHDPHGTRNEDYDADAGEDVTDGSERYRILKGTSYSKVNGEETAYLKSNEMTEWGKHDYTKDAHRSGMADFCVACHKQYLTKKGTVVGGSSGKFKASDVDDDGDIDNDDNLVRFRHWMIELGSLGDAEGIRGLGNNVWENMINSTRLPVEQETYSLNPKGTDSNMCLTCHQAHGTVATMTSEAITSPAKSSTLLRLNNRGVCQACHNR